MRKPDTQNTRARAHDPACPHLYHQVHEALVVIAGHRSVRTHDQVAVNPGGQVDVLACRGRRADGLLRLCADSV